MPNKQFLLCARVIILDKAGRCLLVKRAASGKTNPGKWEFPGGKAELGENFEKALLREVREETGLDVSLTRSIGTVECAMTIGRVIHLVMEGHAGSDLVRLSKEHDQYRWISPKELPEMDMVKEFLPFVREYLLKEV